MNQISSLYIPDTMNSWRNERIRTSWRSRRLLLAFGPTCTGCVLFSSTDALAARRGAEEGAGRSEIPDVRRGHRDIGSDLRPAHYQRDPEKRKAIESHFRFNLEKMVDMAEDHRVRLIFVVPPSNERDFSPFKSQSCRSLTGHRRAQWYEFYDEGRSRLDQGDYGPALDALQRAVDLDACHADLRYRLGQAYFALGRYEEAKGEFVQALDSDVAPLRATSQIQETVREVAGDETFLSLISWLCWKARFEALRIIPSWAERLSWIMPTPESESIRSSPRTR